MKEEIKGDAFDLYLLSPISFLLSPISYLISTIFFLSKQIHLPLLRLRLKHRPLDLLLERSFGTNTLPPAGVGGRCRDENVLVFRVEALLPARRQAVSIG